MLNELHHAFNLPQTERSRLELSFLIALRICQFYKLDLYELISMLSDEKPGCNDLSIIKAATTKGKKAESLKAKVINIKTDQAVPQPGL